MEAAIISMVSVALVIVASVTMMMHSFTSVNTMMESWQEMEEENELIRRTEISVSPPENYTGGIIELLVSNEGETTLSLFDKWDILARYEGGDISYIEYTTDAVPDGNQWNLEGIYLTDNISTEEIFDHNMLNPGESARLNINVSPEIQSGQTGMIVTSTSNGVTSQCMISRP